MLQNLAESITFFLLKRKIVNLNDSDIYIYGFQVVISTLIVTITLLFIGLLFNAIDLTLVFMIVFILLRTYSGGFHCEKFRYCLITSTLILFIELVLNWIIKYEFKLIICMIMSIIASVAICKLSPVEDKNNPLQESDRQRYQKISRIITIIIFLIIVIGGVIFKSLIDYFFIMTLTLMIIAILLLISMFKN